MSRLRLNACLAALGLSAVVVAASAQVSAIPPAATFPNEIKDKVSYHLNRAREIAGGDNVPAFYRRCIMAQVYPVYSNSAEDPYLMPPIQIFDNLYFVGQGAVNAWLVKTSAGLVGIDALNNPDEAENIMMAGLRALGLSPSDLKFVIITHEHGDHYGGVRYLQDTYGVQAVASDVAWQAMDNGTATRPRRNITISDGQLWTVGDTTFRFALTPGHTNGAVSTIFDVRDHGERRVGGLYGGYGIPGSATGKMTQIDSLAYWSQVASQAGVDVLLANHQTQDLGLYNHDLLRHRRVKTRAAPTSPSDYQDPHPYVTGQDKFQRFVQIQSECVRVAAARAGQVLPR